MRFDAGAPEFDVVLRKSRQGDSRAWNQLVESLQGIVWNTIRRTGLNPDDAEEVFHETFLTLYRNLDRIESGNALPKWIATTAGREAIRRFKSTQRHRERTTSDETLLDTLATEDAELAELTSGIEQSDLVRRAVTKLQKPCRDLIAALYYSEEASYNDIAAKLSVKVGSIGPMRARCLDRLRKLLIDLGFFKTESSPTSVAS